MNCLEFRRHKLSDPRRLPDEVRAHAAMCPTCAAFAREVDETENELERALATPVPDGFADRILLHSRKPRVAWRAWALAASVVVAVAMGFSSFQGSKDASDQYARLAIEHVAMEPESLTTLRNADPEALKSVMHDFGGSLKEPLGQIRYLRLCPVDGGFGWHIVFATPEGLATLILVPGKQLPALETASTGGWSALARPARRGYYAIVTASASSTSRFDRLFRERINWGT
jgi:hypothetical protein